MKNILIRYKYTFSILIVLCVGYILIPTPKFNEPTSTVIYSKENKLLGARIASDEQWRFPLIEEAPDKFSTSLIMFEDQYFKYHIGFNPVSIVRAAFQNMKASKVVSGGSTITMQVVRLSRKGKARSIKEKLIELLLATKLELKYSKKEILGLYASYAPFGGNVVGLEAAAWRYYGRPPENLSWAESATLAVLPNAPSLIYPGKNQHLLKNKRDRLLKKLLDESHIDSLTYHLSIQEFLPQKPKKLPNAAPHLLSEMVLKHKGQKSITTIDYNLQNESNVLVENHIKQLKANEIYNAAVLVISNETGEVLVYIGNSNVDKDHGNMVNIINAPRSTGSILKPLLYAALIHEGEMLANSLIPDIPMFMEGFSPKNYSLYYDGAVGAKKALSRSLNIPAVHMLSTYGVSRFHDHLQKLNFTTINQPPDHYGLSLILGGAEATLWDLARVYSGMAKTLNHTIQNNYQYVSTDFDEPTCVKSHQNKSNYSESPFIYNAAAIWQTFEALQEVSRPDNESGWKSFSSAHKIAWKTGTSFGFRDAWAIGVSPEYTVAVWAGNADGEGRPGLTGVTAAAPLLFDVYNLLNPQKWFEEPYDEFIEAPICRESGFLASINCEHIDTIEITENGLRTKPCPYHKLVHLDKTETYQVNSSCENPEDIVTRPWFILPPAMEFYYKQRNPLYLSLPPLKPGCLSEGGDAVMEFVYPKESAKIYIPIDIYGKKGETVFEVAHRNSYIKLFWHLDNEYVGATTDYHQMALKPDLGYHTVTVIDVNGNSLSKRFEIVSK